ncbi:MAG: ribose-phosphate diphosphokinase [Flavobacteriales bacterium]
MILHLDKNFKPFNQPEIEFETFTFSGGEPHIRINTNINTEDDVTITHRLQSFNDFGILLMAIDALKNMGITNIHLVIPYFPGARQDRIINEGEALSVKVYTTILNEQQLTSITIFDPHSDVTPALLNHCRVINNFDFIEQVTQQLPKNILLISPDGGALKKIYKVAAHLKQYEVVECSKSRDLETGKLSKFTVYSEDLKGQPCLIVDDICDGGGTFLGLAKVLKAKNAGPIYLAVSHGIFSKGFDDLNKHFDKIFTTDAFSTLEPNTNLVQIPIF